MAAGRRSAAGNARDDRARRRSGYRACRAGSGSKTRRRRRYPFGNRCHRCARRQSPRSKDCSLSWTGEDTLEARFPIQKPGIYLGAVDLGNQKVLPLAPLSLPYSPEFEPRQDPDEGKKTLAEMARVTGGIDRTAWDDVFNASRLRDRQVRDLIIPLVLMVLVLLLMEIAGRRLLAFEVIHARLRAVRWPRLRRPSRTTPLPDEAPVVSPNATTAVPTSPPPTPARPSVSPLARAKARSRDRTQ